MDHDDSHDYYVYVYIDPRNHEEFYYGKGRGSRKFAHLEDTRHSPKTKRIKEIKAAGLEPIIRVITRGLTEPQALLVEATLLWKLGKFTTNQTSGHFRDRFRPHNRLHEEIAGFDYQNRLYYYNVGESRHRHWADYRRLGFISAGQGRRFRDAMLGFQSGDVFAAYLRASGFVGIGKVTTPAKMVRDVIINGKPFLTLCPHMNPNSDSEEKSEYVALVKWVRAVPPEKAKMRRKSGLFTTQLVRASLQNQIKTVKFLEEEFNVNLARLLR